MLSRLYVSFGFSACGKFHDDIQLVLPRMAFQGAAIFRAGTVFPQLTAGTPFRRGLVFVVVTLFMVVSSLQQVPCRTGEGVSVWVIGKGLFREDTFLPS